FRIWRTKRRTRTCTRLYAPSTTNAMIARDAPLQKAFCSASSASTLCGASGTDDAPEAGGALVGNTAGRAGRAVLVGGCWMNGVGDGPAVGGAVGGTGVADGKPVDSGVGCVLFTRKF